MAHLRLTHLLLLLGFASAPVAAQDEAAAPVTDLDELVVTVGRQELLQSETPAPVSVMPRLCRSNSAAPISASSAFTRCVTLD